MSWRPAHAPREQYLGTALHLTLLSAAHSSCSLGPPSSAASGLMGCEGISGCGTSCVAQSLGRVHPQTEVPFGLSGFESCDLSHMTCYIQTTGTTRWVHSQWLARYRQVWVYLCLKQNSPVYTFDHLNQAAKSNKPFPRRNWSLAAVALSRPHCKQQGQDWWQFSHTLPILTPVWLEKAMGTLKVLIAPWPALCLPGVVISASGTDWPASSPIPSLSDLRFLQGRCSVVFREWPPTS